MIFALTSAAASASQNLTAHFIDVGQGDSILLQFNEKSILIDGGPAHTYPALRERILHLPANARRFDLLVITHVDADHIEGVIRLLMDAEALHCQFDRIWFNGRDQLNAVPDPAGQPLGALQGEILGMLIADYEARTGTRCGTSTSHAGRRASTARTARCPWWICRATAG